MILRQAKLLGGAEGHLVDIVIVDGTISQIAPAGTLTVDAAHEEIVLDGRVIIPGLWDEHVHMGVWAGQRKTISLAAATTAAEAAGLMAAGAPENEEIVVGVAYRDGFWPDRKTKALLDQYAPTTAWVLWSVDVHSCWLNSAACALLGVETTDDSGVLQERDAFALAEKMAARTASSLDALVDEAAAQAASRGVVGIVDLDLADNRNNWMRRRAGSTEFSLRVEAGVYPEWLDLAVANGDFTGKEIAPGVRVGPLKVITDGSLNTRTAFTVEPYLGVEGGDRGQMNYSGDYLEQLLVKAKEHGFLPAYHAIGDRANKEVLDLFEQVGVGGRIEHAQLLRREDLQRFAGLGVTASVQPQHAIDDREVADRYWADRTERVLPLRWLVDSGAQVVFGSDAPVSPLDPLVQIAAAVARTDDQRPPWHGEHALTVMEAISCSTRSTLEVGQPADIVALGADPLWLEGALSGQPGTLYSAIASLPVDLTLVDGRVSHSAL